MISWDQERGSAVELALRPGERELSAIDERTLRLLATPLALALGALRLSTDLRASRARLVVGREEERRRLRRDLHDGLGPALTGIALTAEAAANSSTPIPTAAANCWPDCATTRGAPSPTSVASWTTSGHPHSMKWASWAPSSSVPTSCGNAPTDLPSASR